MPQSRLFWFAAGFLMYVGVDFLMRKMRDYLRKVRPCPSCEGDGYVKSFKS